MKLHTIAAVALVVIVASAGVAVAAPGNAPDDAGANDSAHGESHDAPDGEANEETPVDNSHANERGKNASAADRDTSVVNAQGPGEDRPEQVPDHVAQIHDKIRQFLDGALDSSLGEAISGVTAADSASGNAAAASG